jgi:hypothetical protein
MLGGEPRQGERHARLAARGDDAVAAREQLVRHFVTEAAVRSADESLHPCSAARSSNFPPERGVYAGS